MSGNQFFNFSFQIFSQTGIPENTYAVILAEIISLFPPCLATNLQQHVESQKIFN